MRQTEIRRPPGTPVQRNRIELALGLVTGFGPSPWPQSFVAE